MYLLRHEGPSVGSKVVVWIEESSFCESLNLVRESLSRSLQVFSLLGSVLVLRVLLLVNHPQSFRLLVVYGYCSPRY